MCRFAMLLFVVLAVTAVVVTEAQREPSASKCQVHNITVQIILCECKYWLLGMGSGVNVIISLHCDRIEIIT